MSVTAERQQVFSDLELARRLERAEGRANAEFVEARAKLFPESGACWAERAGTYAMFDGVESPLTQTFGLGLFDTVTPADAEALEEFFTERGAPVFHEVSPLADAKAVALLNERGYEPFEFTSVMFRPLAGGAGVSAPDGRISVRLAVEGEQSLWAQTAAAGWGEFEELAEFMLELSEISARREGALSFLAELDGRAIATGGLFVSDGVALLAGASTIPEGRRQGAQLALLDARLRYAAERGCDLAMMCALPGSASQRNAERQGFRIAYTRLKWRLRRAERESGRGTPGGGV
ncbi:MAG TPA: GNAT family N-acetyltransferase [Pyrinomonadaceae bacterium]|nr:GNAT family N-acetyltransferase [Pyrinomonadaceae bacterium]